MSTHLRQAWAALIEGGARGDLPKGIRFTYSKGTKSGDNNAFDTVEAFLDGERVGIIEWWNADVESGSRGDFGKGMIRWIEVPEKWRRRGIAKALFDEAKKRVSYRIYHSYDLSDTGRPWAKDVGGQIGWDHMQPGYVSPYRAASRFHGSLVPALQTVVDGFAQGAAAQSWDDPMGADAMCIQAEYAFRQYVAKHPAIRYHSWYLVGCKRMSDSRMDYMDYQMGTPERADHNAPAISLDGKDWWVVDWTYRQFDENTAWPLVEPEAEYLKRWTTKKMFNA